MTAQRRLPLTSRALSVQPPPLDNFDSARSESYQSVHSDYDIAGLGVRLVHMHQTNLNWHESIEAQGDSQHSSYVTSATTSNKRKLAEALTPSDEIDSRTMLHIIKNWNQSLK